MKLQACGKVSGVKHTLYLKGLGSSEHHIFYTSTIVARATQFGTIAYDEWLMEEF